MEADSGRHKPADYDLGWWPEVVGTVLVVGMLAFLIIFATGIM